MGDDQTAAEELESDFDGLVIQGDAMRRTMDHSLVEWEYDYSIRFPRLPAGVHVGRLFFELPEVDTGRSISMTKAVQVLVTDGGPGAQ